MTDQALMPTLQFPDGLVGCPDWQHFHVERPAEMAPLALLVSEDQPGLSLPVVNPWLIRVDYAPQLAEADHLALQSAAPADLEWLVILNIQAEPPLMTANLLGPLVINRQTGVARQVILSLSGYPAAYLLGGTAEPAQSEVSHARADTAV